MHTHQHEYPQVHLPQVPLRRLLKGQTAIVTGASSGIGKAIAVALGAAGANVCVNYVTGPEKAEEVVKEIDGSGGFASGIVSGVRTRRYHGLLVPATAPPAGHTVLVNGFQAWEYLRLLSSL